jgi:hypothetical protein
MEFELSTVSMGPQVKVGDIPRLIRNRTEGLYFQLRYGDGSYYGPAIKEYPQTLTRYPFLKYIILIDRAGQFVGLADVRELYRVPSSRGSPFSAEDFARWNNTVQREPPWQPAGLRASPGRKPQSG